MASHCADCTACCTVFEIKPLAKAFGEPCKHLGPTLFGHGCTIYADRPMPCQQYVCLWLDSQRKPGMEMHESLRPNVSKVVLGWPWGEDRETLFVYPLPGHETAWQYGAVARHLKMILARGGKIVVVAGEKRIALKGDTAIVGTEEEFSQILS